jgi:hypothetical protein
MRLEWNRRTSAAVAPGTTQLDKGDAVMLECLSPAPDLSRWATSWSLTTQNNTAMTIVPLTPDRFDDFARLIEALADYDARPDAAALANDQMRTRCA